MSKESAGDLTVLFADICRSTDLFDKLGDQLALDLIMEALQLVRNIATENHGNVISATGDEVMCTFSVAEDALITAKQIHLMLRDSTSLQKHHIMMRVGINSGTAIRASNSVYGDTVNIAARLAQQAKANQSLVSSATIATVSEKFSDQFRLVDQINMQGKPGAIEVHELLETGDKEQVTEVSSTGEITKRSFLMTASYQTRNMRFTPMLVRFVFGRNMTCNQVIDHPTISREHAEFIYRNGRFVLRDFSTNGSVVIQNHNIEQLRRSSTVLKGEGKIYLGKTSHQPEFCIKFSCMNR